MGDQLLIHSLNEEIKNLKRYYNRAKEKVREKDRKIKELRECIRRNRRGDKMDVDEYKKKVIILFRNGKASNNAWIELGEVLLVASESGDLQYIDQEALSEEEYKEIQ